MLRALYTAATGMQAQQINIDTIANNIANVNTTAFKASRVTFQDMMSQTTSGASAPTTNRAGTNPVQVGLGMQLAGIDVLQAQGPLESTGR